jgi:dephospho-CoA kinase
MNSVFITGIPTSGKSYLAETIAASLGIECLKMDAVREEMVRDAKLEPWVNFFWNKNEKEYYQNTPPEIHWQNLVKQSEAFWPTKKQKIVHILTSGKPTIFESVNLLPHLLRELPIRGVVLLGQTEDEVLKRLQRQPRWGATEELQKLEADSFINVERPHYLAEAEKYGYPAFSNPKEAEAELIRLIRDL